jgi:hypothetical protein
MGSLAQRQAVFQEQEAEFSSWYSKTPLGKKREKVLSGDTGEDEDVDTKKKKKGGKKKKK